MGVAQSVVVTGTAMFHHQFFLFVCTLSVSTSSPQSYFHNFGNQGTFTSVTHGTHSQTHRKPPAYSAPSPPSPPSYSHPSPAYTRPSHPAPPPAVKSFYHAPIAKPAAYHAPLPKPYVHHHQHPRPSLHHPAQHVAPPPHGPGVDYGREKCNVDYVEKDAEVCVPTFKTECETEDIVDNEVCAYSFTLVPVETEAKLVDVKWEKSCTEDTICVNPHHTPGGYAAPTHCVEEYRHVCYLSPILYPVIKKIVIKLPKPVETCINKQVLLPRLECDKVHERRCMLVPRTHPGPTVKLDKCSIVVGDPTCTDTVLQLPRQGCLQKLTKLRTVYQVEEQVSYTG